MNDDLDRRLRDLHTAIGRQLNGLLDLDAGLREALTDASHRRLGHTLDRVLDLDAGLAAIVGGGGHMSDYPTSEDAKSDLTSQQAIATATVEGQIIMPFYIICDASASMSHDMDELNRCLRALQADIVANPVVNDLTMLSIITFHSTAQTIVPLSSPSEINMPTLTVGGATNYGAAFREFVRAFKEDRARLKAEGKKVYRPCVFFLSDGEPTDPDFLSTFRSVIAYDPETRTGNKAFPYIVTFGFRQATEKVMAQLAYPDFGTARGRWFLSRTGNIGELLKSMTSTIGSTIVNSGMSGNQGTQQIIPPSPPSWSGMRSGEAGDSV